MLWLIPFVFLVLIYGFFAGVETGIISLNKIKLKKMADENNKRAQFIQKITSKTDEFLIVTLLGQNISMVLNSIIAANFFLPFFEIHFGPVFGKIILSGLIITPITLLFSETLPKEIFRQKADYLILKCSFLIKWSFIIMKIPSRILLYFVKIFLPKFENNQLFFNKEEIEQLITISDKSGALHPEQKKMMEGIFDLSDTKVDDIMTPRVNIIGVDLNTKVSEVFDLVEKYGYSRIPVYENSIDDIEGFIFVLDIIHSDDVDIENDRVFKFIRKITFVPETKKIDYLFTEMKQNKEQIRLVVDEHGQLSGLVTLEDIIEEIVGEIHDEYDEEEVFGKLNKDGSIHVSAMIEIDEINEKFKMGIPENGNYGTLGGFIEHVLGVIPKTGEEFEWKNYIFKIISMNNNSIGEVHIITKKKPEITKEKEKEIAEK
ncbi:MAG: hemolysin family protein [Candidatus Muiribacteriota bacterium]